MRVLVTGGMGFIGSNLVKRLHSEGHVIDIVDDMSNGHEEFLSEYELRSSFPGLKYGGEDRKFIRYFEGDFAGDVLRSVAMGIYDVVFHLAAVPRVSFSVENPALAVQVD